jgi:hypothetical protein
MAAAISTLPEVWHLTSLVFFELLGVGRQVREALPRACLSMVERVPVWGAGFGRSWANRQSGWRDRASRARPRDMKTT